VGRASGMLKDLSNEITKTAPPPGSKAPSAPAMAPRGAQPQPPISGEIHQPESTALQVIQTIIGPMLQPLATAGIVIVFVVFFLLQREGLRDRFIRLAGARDLQRTTRALEDAGRRLSRYLLEAPGNQRIIGLQRGDVVDARIEQTHDACDGNDDAGEDRQKNFQSAFPR
jgi:hypothetical protein